MLIHRLTWLAGFCSPVSRALNRELSKYSSSVCRTTFVSLSMLKQFQCKGNGVRLHDTQDRFSTFISIYFNVVQFFKLGIQNFTVVPFFDIFCEMFINVLRIPPKRKGIRISTGNSPENSRFYYIVWSNNIGRTIAYEHVLFVVSIALLMVEHNPQILMVETSIFHIFRL